MLTESFPGASRLGFGCAALGSRVSRADSSEALSVAYALGVNWFDTAPSYGDGSSEKILGEFIRGRRDNVHICTKCGIDPGDSGTAYRIVKPIGRALLRILPNIRKNVKPLRPNAVKSSITPEKIHRSIDRSLHQLGTSYVDVYVLHEPCYEDIHNEENIRALEDVVLAGKAKYIGVAGSLDAALWASRNGPPLSFLQIAAPPFSKTIERLHAAPSKINKPLTSIHSVFAGDNWLVRLSKLAGSRRHLQEILARHGYEAPLETAVYELLLDHALDRNAGGLVLVSMASKDHARRNALRLDADAGRSRAVLAAIRQLSVE